MALRARNILSLNNQFSSEKKITTGFSCRRITGQNKNVMTFDENNIDLVFYSPNLHYI